MPRYVGMLDFYRNGMYGISEGNGNKYNLCFSCHVLLVWQPGGDGLGRLESRRCPRVGRLKVDGLQVVERQPGSY